MNGIREPARACTHPTSSLFEQLVHASVDGVLAFDPALRITLWNRAMERLFGVRGKDVIGQPLLDVFPFFRAIGEVPRLTGALAGEHASSHGLPFHVPETGRKGFFDAHYGPLRGEMGEVVGGHVIVHDVTAQRRADDRATETEERFRTMADCAPVLLWMAGTNGECEYFNQVWLDFTGRTMEEELGIGWSEGVHAEDFQACMDTFVDAFNARRPFEMVYRLRRHDGAYRHILDNGVPRYTPLGAFAGFIGSCIDITDRVEDDTRRKELVTQLEGALRAREEFISIASHELRTPLTSLKLHTQRLLRWLSPDSTTPIDHERLERLATASHHQMVRLERLLESMLTGSRLANEGVALEPMAIDLARAVRDTIERFEIVADAAGAELVVVTDGPVEGTWDPACIDQILLNLLMNAVKYGEGRPIEVDVRADDPRAMAVVRVRDHGRGIAERDRERIFERFERAVSSNEVSGLGLGLFIVKRLTEAHGGHVRVEACADGGSVFVVELPRSPASINPPAPSRP